MMIKHPITVISHSQKKSSSWYGNSGANSNNGGGNSSDGNGIYSYINSANTEFLLLFIRKYACSILLQQMSEFF
jgi:hypothetical protein